MTDKCIIYQTDTGGVAVITPLECGLTLEQIALKDVPEGKPFKIVDATDVPTDRAVRDFWAVDEADLTDGIGAPIGSVFVPQPVAVEPEGESQE
ncbi:hypothetical protein SAMN05444149_101884 [Pseudosulfitobacter pseudonitzschiae]|uniref:Uncharacterized protein n=1 Tax=Pseudosulfitobacter pseudonitzschiae TaxID=1402135 RepID=A0A073JI96_9RHOB|nr:hypothetical protein [Pseudosulfitobacter pseudonitzschiae]KEJ97437.1 hypothetical protein SUH3_00190 [Pseudosulfitobacter pseudonitzschiae]QKS08728.1 hypothetical protein HT745_09680 [Pseudosulfitobacter pseudonitzschiae]SHE70892.1 hypothetical protein SAMN05444149_101884 [Pseudosulfitobacter pseudonitzschiae]